jgi:16S rRNA A1518/A1519 N6-dimethyltransferase RsmA/KsgA/DIM1 with predicted DNA glycosylase/AP lyase activity
MVPVRKNMDTFEVFYHDPATGELWKSFFPKGFKEHKGPKLLRPEPLPQSLELQLEICLNSPDDSDAIGLGIECSVKPEKWEEIINVLDKNRKKYLRSHLNTFIKHLGVLNPDDLFEEIELDLQKLGLEKELLSTLKKRAKRIKLKRFFRI